MTKQTSLTESPYFTILPSGGGLTAHLLQFNSFYKLGISLGYRYIHTPFKSRRSSNKIYNFLGFNRYFAHKIIDFKIKNLWWLRKHNFISLDISDDLLKTNKVNNLQDLQSLIRDRVSQFQSDKRLTLVRFRTLGKRALFHDLVQTQIKEFPEKLNLYSLYLKTRDKSSIQSRFIENKVKLLVHIRQGDTAIIETPWHTYIPTQGSNQLTELDNLNASDRGCESIEVSDFYDFVKKFVTYFNEDNFSVVVSSDSYRKGFNLIYKNIRRFNFSSHQIKELKKTQILYEKKFEVFKSIKNSVCIIGENDTNLFDLVHSSLIADVIVVGTQQRFIPKLLSSYYNLDNPPLMFVLYKREKIPNYENLALTPDKVTIVPVELDNFNADDLMTTINEKISMKCKNN